MPTADSNTVRGLCLNDHAALYEHRALIAQFAAETCPIVRRALEKLTGRAA